MRKPLAFVVAIAFVCTAWVGPGAVAAELPDGVTKVASVEGITEYELDNGLRFLLFPDQSKQQITVNITYLVGSRHEAYGETGMAHLLEHLVFKGTPDHPNIDDELTERGAFPNGTTWLDRTNYFETFPATEDNLAWALDLEADRMINSFISAEDLESEMTVVRNEMESGENNPSRILSARVASAAYLWHNYGNSTIGARSDVENVPIDRLQAFYRKYYQPDNAVLVVAGKFEPERAIELVAQEFGPTPRPDRSGANQIFPTYTAEPAQDGERTVSLSRVGDVQIAMAAFHVPAGSHEDFAAAKVLNHILGNEPAGRLYTNLVEPGLAARVSSYAMQMREPGLLMGDAEVRLEDSLDAATEALLATFDELAAEPPTEEEVERAKTYYRASIELAFNNPQFIALSLSEWAAMGDWRLIFIDRDRLEQVTPEDVHRVAQTYLMPSNRTLGFFHPTEETPVRAEVPPPPVVAEVVAGYTGREAVAEGEAFDPTPQNIEARTRKITLSSGMKVAMLAKENRGDAVSVRFTFRGGNEEALMGKATAAQIAASMLMRGTENRSRQEISDEMDRLKTQSSLSGSIFGAGGSLVTVRESLPDVLRLGAEVLKQPAFDQGEFDTLRQEILAGIESQRSEPQALVSVAMQRHIGPRESTDHPLYTPTFDERIERVNSVTIEDARAFHEAVYGAEAATLALVGDFDPDEIAPLLEELFGDWDAGEPFKRIADPHVAVETVNIDIETPDKANAFMLAVATFPMSDSHPDYAAMTLGNFMLGGGFLNSRLAKRIRQEEGLSYGVGSQFQAHPIDESGAFLTYAIFSPENRDRVVTAFQEEVAKALEEGFTQEEVDAAKSGYLDIARNQRANDTAVAGTLANNLYFNRTMDFTIEHEAKIAELTPESILAAMRRHLSVDGISIFRGGDFANKLAAQSDAEE